MKRTGPMCIVFRRSIRIGKVSSLHFQNLQETGRVEKSLLIKIMREIGFLI